MNISPINVEPAQSERQPLRGKKILKGFTKQDEACHELILRMVGDKWPQYVEPLYRYFQNHELAFDFLNAGRTEPRSDGIIFTLDVETEKRGVFSYAPVKVDVTWAELDRLIAEGKL